MKALGLGLSILFFTLLARADFYQGIRQMGMGGAAVAVVNDETALLLNPIGLGRLREPYVTLIDPEITTNKQSLGAVQSLLMDAIDVEEVYSELAGRLDERYFVRAQMFPSFVDRHYGFGLLMKYDVQATRLSSNQFLDLNYTSDWAAVAGFNHSFYGGVVKVGVTGKWIDRVQSRSVVDPGTQGLNLENIASAGAGLGADVGLSLSSPTDWLPTISVLAKDVGDTSFTLSDGMRDSTLTTDPEKVPMTVDVAVALFPIFTKSTRGTFTIEYDDVMDSDTDGEKKLHAGVEINLADQLFFRGGWNRGYLTAGFEWATPFLQIQMAYYGEEIGTNANPIKDERFALKAVLRF